MGSSFEVKESPCQEKSVCHFTSAYRQVIWVSCEFNQTWCSSRGKEFSVHLSLGLEDYLIPPLRTSLHYWEVLEMCKGKEETVRAMHHSITQVGEREVSLSVPRWELAEPPMYPTDHRFPFPVSSAFSQCCVDGLRRSLWLT